MRLVLVGAGSKEFGPATMRDILLSETLNARDLQIVLMDLSRSSLEVTLAHAQEVAAALGRRAQISCTTDLSEALPGADFVICAIEFKRYYYWAQDFHVPRQYGFRQIYGENGGAGGLFHALRNMGPMLEVASQMATCCPDAWLLNYTNPLTKLCQALVSLVPIRTIGLCHGVLAGKKQLSNLLGLPVNDFVADASGLNHCTWFQSIVRKDTCEDLYPQLRAQEREAHPLGEWDEIALSRILLRTFGLYPSPGTNHIGEYIGWAQEFLGSSLLQFYYDPADGHPWETGQVPAWVYNLHQKATSWPLFDEVAVPASDREYAELAPSGELAVPIIEGLRCGAAQELDAVNVPNEGFVPGLPDGTVVEVPARVDEHGLHPRAMPPLPEAVQALLRTQVSINQLLIEAFSEGSRNKLLQALLLDPTTASYRQAASLVKAMCQLQGDVLPPLA